MNENNREDDNNIKNEKNNNSDNENNGENQDLKQNENNDEDQELTKDGKNVDDQDLTKDENKTDFQDILNSKSIQENLSGIQTFGKQLGATLSNLQTDFTLISQNLANSIKNIQINPELTKAIENIQNSYTAISKAMQSPVIQWLQNFDYSSLYQALQQLSDRINPEIFRRALYEHLYDTHWFPGLLINTEWSLMEEIIEIVAHTRTVKSETKKIDKAIFDFYTEKRIEDIRKSWKDFKVPGYIIQILRDGVQAYYSKQYGVTVIVLSSLWERIIYDKAGDDTRRIGRRSKENFHALVEENNYPEILSSYYDEFIMYECECSEETKPDSPGRNSAAHGFFSKYPTRKAALNAILFTDILVRLQPIQK